MKTIGEFLSELDTRIYSRGVQYYETHRVARLVRDGAHCSAQVCGSAWEPYDVDILLSEDDQVRDWHCTCPYDGGEVCKHVAAVLLAVQNGEAKKKKAPLKKPEGEPAVSLETLLSSASKETLAALILEHAGEDKRFYNEALSVLGAPAGQELAAAKELIRASIRRNTSRGYIDQWGCDAICGDMDGVLETARRRIERGQYAAALPLVLEMLVTGVRLGSEADSSSGALGGTVDYSLELLEEAADGLKTGRPEEKRSAWNLLLKAAKNKAFDGWDEWRYQLLNCAARLADKKSAPKLWAVLDSLLDAADKSEYGREYMIEANMETRLHLTETMEGTKAARDFLSRHLDMDRLRELAVLMDMEAGEYQRAETLCLEKAEAVSRNSGLRPSRWHELLRGIYRVSGQEEKLTAQLRTMLLLGDLKCYDELKERLQAEGRWEREYSPLLKAIAAARPSYEYMQILAKESELARLMRQVEGNPDAVFTYGALLAREYPQRTYDLCAQQIRLAGGRAGNRKGYQRLCALLGKLAGFGGTAEARRLIIELRAAYPRRSALQEELAKTERGLKEHA